MYGWIFSHLPGPLAARIVTSILLVALAVAALVVWVFPLLSEFTPFSRGTIGPE